MESSCLISFELRERDGGEIHDADFRLFATQLGYEGALDHVIFNPESLVDDVELSYIILHVGHVPTKREDDRGCLRFFTYDWGEMVHWTAGLCCLHFPNPDDRSTAQIAIALLPEAREKGYGRAAMHKLCEYAFDALRVHRVMASIVCPIRPEHPAGTKKQIELETKKLCWVFEQYGFHFEGISRCEVKAPQKRSQTPVWYDVYRMSLLETDYLATQASGLFSGGTMLKGVGNASPWESMMRRHEEEKRQIQILIENTETSSVDEDEFTLKDDYFDDGDSDEYEDPEDFDD